MGLVYLKKKNKANFIGIIFVAVAVLFCSISFYFFYQDMQAQIDEWQNTTWFVFSNDIDTFAQAEYISTEEIAAYETTTDIYNQGVYFNSLNEREKVIYKAYQYALDHNYIYTYVDGTMLTESDRSAMDIIVFLSLDSGIVQQNLSTVEYTSSHTVYNRFYWKEVSKDVEGYIVSAETFSEKRIDKVNKAIEELEKVDFGFSEDTSDKEKAWEIFKYVEDNVDYFPDSESTEKSGKVNKSNNFDNVEDYLYSAVFRGKTNCDGFANMYSLLCQMNGLNCFEKVSSAQTDEDAGHTWNAVSIDGKWYNVDCTEAVYEDEDEELIEIYELLQFGFSDSLQSDKHDYKDITPACSENILPVDKQFSSPGASGVASSIAQSIRVSEENRAIVVFVSFDEDDFKDTAQGVVNRLWSSIYYIIDERAGCTICYIYK